MSILIRPPKKVKKAKKKSRTAKELLQRLQDFLNAESEEPVEILYSFWGDQQNAITYKELRELVQNGDLTQEQWQEWQQDYSKLVASKLDQMWQKAMEAGISGQPIFDKFESFELDMKSPGVVSWIKERGAAFVTASTDEQKKAIQSLLAKKVVEKYTVDELARIIRPCIGLTKQDSEAVMRQYDALKKNLREQHPRMKAESIQRKALDAAQKYAERKHRQRAMTIAQTELAFAYNRGADQGVRQAQEQGLLGKTIKRWITSGDDSVCSTCEALDGTEIEMDDNFNFGGRLLFVGHKMLPPAHPRCACAVEYVEVEPPMLVPEESMMQDWETQIRQQQAEYEAKFEDQKLDKEVYQEAAAGIAEVGYEATAEQVVEMVNSVNTYTGEDFTDILAAQQNFKGRFADYSGIMSGTQKAKALQDVKNISQFLEYSPTYEGSVYRGLGFDVGGPMDDGRYDSFRKLYQKGKVIQTDTFTSWTKDEDFLREVHAARTMLDEECEYSVEVTIRMKNCESGVDISRYAELQGQQEVLFDNKTSLKVLDVKEHWKNDEVMSLVIDVEEV